MGIESLLWVAVGFCLVVGEMLTGGFFLLFVALGCFLAAIAAFFSATYLIQGVTCSAMAIFGIFVLRKPIQERLLRLTYLNADIGQEINIDQVILPHQQNRITYQGTSWLAKNLDSAELKPGDQAIIAGIEGNILLIRRKLK